MTIGTVVQPPSKRQHRCIPKLILEINWIDSVNSFVNIVHFCTFFRVILASINNVRFQFLEMFMSWNIISKEYSDFGTK